MLESSSVSSNYNPSSKVETRRKKRKSSSIVEQFFYSVY